MGPNILLDKLSTMSPNSSLSMMDLTRKTVSLIAVLSLSRRSSLACLGPSFQLKDTDIVIPLTSLEKTPRPGFVRGELSLPSSVSGSPLCPVTCLRDYLDRWDDYDNDDD